MSRHFIVPEEDGDIFVSPSFQTLCEKARTPKTSSTWQPGGRAICELADELRRDLSQQAGMDPAVPWIGVGHQPVFYYPGIIAKDILGGCVAEEVKGMLLHTVVDTDAAESWMLKLPPVGLHDTCRRIPLGDGTQTYQVYRNTRIPGSEDLNAALAEYAPNIRTLEDFVGFQWRLASSSIDLAPFILYLSDLCKSSAFAHLIAWTIAPEKDFQKIHNRAAGDYRTQNRIRSRAHPVPDLVVDGALRELPFWTFDSKNGRRPLFLEEKDGYVKFLAGGEVFLDITSQEARSGEQLHRALGRTCVQIQSRALMTSLFLKGFVYDLFIHGIGGGRYELITDAIFQNLTGEPPPMHAVASATLKFDQEKEIALKLEKRRLTRQVRDIRYNPDYFSDRIADQKLRSLIADKDALKQKIQKGVSSPEIFQNIRKINARLSKPLTDFACATKDELKQTSGLLAGIAGGANRAFPFFVYDPSQLAALRTRFKAHVP